MAYILNEDFYQGYNDRLWKDSNTRMYIMNTGTMLIPGGILDYIYDPANNFFFQQNVFTQIFGQDVQNAIQSIRFYPFDFSSVYTLSRWGNYFTIGGKSMNSVMGTDVGNGAYSRSDTDTTENLLSFGDVYVPLLENVDSFLSYTPFTKMQLYLPFYGLYDLDTKRFAGKVLELFGVVDLGSGDMYYYITSAGKFVDSVKCHIATELKVYGNNIRERLDNVARNVLAVAHDMTNQKSVSVAPFVFKLTTFEETHNQLTRGDSEALQCSYNPLKPCLLVYHPNLKYHLNDTRYNHLYGVPCRSINTLTNFSGFTKVSAVHMKDMTNTTQEEVREIEEILKDGFINNGGTATLSISYSTSHILWSNTQNSITYGSSYSNTYTLDTNYQLDDIQVTMGGIDITATAVSGSHITISSVTGNVIIRTTTSKIPQTFTITYVLTGATSSNIQATIIEGETFRTTLTPIYSQGYYRGGQLCTIAMTGSSTITTPDSNIVINNVSGNITITLTCPQATTMNVENWIPNAYLATPADVILNIGGLILYKNSNSAEITTSATIDSSPDIAFNNSFIYGVGNIVGGATNVMIGVNGNKTITYDDSNPTEWGQMTKLHFISTDNWTTQPELLEWVDNNFTKET